MNRTAIVAFPITTFLIWWFYVVTRSGSGVGLKWDRIPNHISISAVFIGSFYLAFVVIALLVLYFTRIRGGNESAMSLLLSAIVKFAIVFVAAVAIGSPLGELYVLADERAFRRETAELLATAKPDPVTGDMPYHSRNRWWPGSTNSMNSLPDPPKR